LSPNTILKLLFISFFAQISLLFRLFFKILSLSQKGENGSGKKKIVTVIHNIS